MKPMLSLALCAAMLSACLMGCGNKNVSSHPGGMITDPTGTTAATNPMPTMTDPSIPVTTDGTNPTGSTQGTDATGDTNATQGSESMPGTRSRQSDSAYQDGMW